MSPRFRSSAEDFVVEELPAFEPEGEGDHAYLEIEKVGESTHYVARHLARRFDVRPMDVGYAGRKDRLARTRQWFSVLDPKHEVTEDLDLEGVRVVALTRHRHKLRTGQLRRNRFVLRIREVDATCEQRCQRAARSLRERGIPNRFGRQRFGRSGDNAAAGLRALQSKRLRGDRRHARFLVSALQSAVFNDVLKERELRLPELSDGDYALRHETGKVFLVDDAESLAGEAARLEVSPTGPMFGTKSRLAEGVAGEIEKTVLERWDVPVPPSRLALPRGLKLPGSRRALRVPVPDLELSYDEPEQLLEARFELSPGSYATVLLDELFPEDELREGPATSESSESP